MMTKQLLMAFAAPVAMIAVPADAATFAFNLTGAYNAAFTIDSVLLTPPGYADADMFILDDLDGTFEGTARTAESIAFNVASYDGGLTIQLGSTFRNFFGAALFTGTTAAPTFRTGSFALLEDGDATLASTLTIGEVAAPIPEPAGWALMMAGFGIVGYAMRRRRATVRLQPA